MNARFIELGGETLLLSEMQKTVPMQRDSAGRYIGFPTIHSGFVYVFSVFPKQFLNLVSLCVESFVTIGVSSPAQNQLQAMPFFSTIHRLDAHSYNKVDHVQ